MADKRMFSMKIIDSDAFLEMPLSTQALYFHLSMRADDDGFLNNAKRITNMVGANQNDYDLLVAKKFVIQFPEGICVIKHWKINNYIRNDRYKETVYVEEKEFLEVARNGSYTIKSDFGIPKSYQTDTQYRLDKIRLDKNRVEENNTDVLLAPPPKSKQINYQKIVNSYNRICKSYSKIKKLSKARKDAIKARLNTYTEDELIEVFEKAEASDFMRGKNNRNWKATFDWMIKDSNMAKILDGNYDNSTKKEQKKANKFNDFSQRQYSDSEILDLERKLLSR